MKRYILLITTSLFVWGCQDTPKKTTAKNETTEVIAEPTTYEIVSTEDQSKKALGNKPLSHYTTTEIRDLPVNKKHLYSVVLPQDVKSNQIKPTIDKIISDLTQEDTDLDEITLWLYSQKDISHSAWDIGTATWAPHGELGNVDADIALSNNRNSYSTSYDIMDNLDEYLIQKSKSEDKFGMSEDERKQFYKELVKAEDKAYASSRVEEDKVLAKNLSQEQLRAELDKIHDKRENLRIQYTEEVLKKYNLTQEQQEKITEEAFNENWPMD